LGSRAAGRRAAVPWCLGGRRRVRSRVGGGVECGRRRLHVDGVVGRDGGLHRGPRDPDALDRAPSPCRRVEGGLDESLRGCYRGVTMEPYATDRFEAAKAAFFAVHDEDPARPRAAIYHETLAAWVERLPRPGMVVTEA